MSLEPANFSLMKAWSALKEARKNRNGLSAAIYNKWAECNALPKIDDPECDTLTTYRDFVKKHNAVWLMAD